MCRGGLQIYMFSYCGLEDEVRVVYQVEMCMLCVMCWMCLFLKRQFGGSFFGV